MKLTAIVLTYNSENEIIRTLDSLTFCDEIIVIDDESVDKTREIVENRGIKLYRHPLQDNFSAQRNFGLEKVKDGWVLFIDSDEVVSSKLADEIKSTINNTNKNGFYLKRQDFFGGKLLRYGESVSWELRLARVGFGNWNRNVHEVWKVRGSVGKLKNILIHYSHPNLDNFIEDINYYSTLHADELKKEGKISNIFRIIFWPIAKLKYIWICKLGFLDKDEGFVFALIMSFHSFLSWSKQWIKSQKKLV